MGIPKFFRYISERYPLTSQLIQENKIPEFDNLYLDFNGIIHNCSHPNDNDVHLRLSKEQIFTSIFAYVDHLFGTIKPKKLFFMAVDGVAPRAKMNQQRSRRFRTAKEAKEAREKAERKGETLPKQEAFDSNCITPGTVFMAQLSEQLRYFINKKITEDSNWRDIEVVLSGHEVPGEGEHKIMEYIRLARAQPDYNPNVRHCLYGLDADLIMLGLLSHDPHFCLLREEVKFGPSARKKGNTSLESINFYLLHLSLLREYLDLEFNDIASVLPFEYNLERVIDDFILLAVFVGNDFLPNLPDLHIHQNGLERLFEVYKKVLPTLDGYLNESGTINARRLQVILDEMAIWEREIFEKEYADMNWFKGKQAKHVAEMELARKRNSLVLTKPQREIVDKVKAFILNNRQHPTAQTKLSMPNEFSARERAFINRLADDLYLSVSWDEYDEDDMNIVTWRLPGALEHGDGIQVAEDNDSEWEDENDAESWAAVDRVLQKYEKSEVKDDDADGGFDARYEQSMQEKMAEWKRGYYKDKLEINYNDPKLMGALIYRYIEGLQWVMYYYYSGVASWGWFYNYHYAPRISDLKGVDQMIFQFELGMPFKPFQQLMGVLPVASMKLIPTAYQDLMYDPNSPILDFYPLDFEQDLNGKKQEWEAIVKIPFIDEARLLHAMAGRDHRLTDEEKRRNTYGTSTKFAYNPSEPTNYPSSLPGFFPTIYRCQCVMEPFDLPTLDGLHLVPGLCEGVFLGAEALAGFPSLQTLPHSATLAHHGVNVHKSESRNKSMIVRIENPHEARKPQDIAEEMVGERTFMGWPFLQEGLVVAVSDPLFRYEKMSVVVDGPKRVIPTPHLQHNPGHWKMKAERIEERYSKRFGVITGEVEVLLHVRPLKGLKRLETGALVKDYEGPDKEVEEAVQMCLSNVASEDPRFLEREAPPLSEEFPEGTRLFFLGEHAYGVAAQVVATNETNLSVMLAIYPTDKDEAEKFKAIVDNRAATQYWSSFKAAERLGISTRALSRITSSLMVIGLDGQKVNLGLSLKFEAKALKVVNYSRKEGRTWEFSEKAIDLIAEYQENFPEVFLDLNRSGDGMAKAENVFADFDPQRRIKEIQGWLKSKGVRDFEPVSLFCDQLSKDTVTNIEKLADDFKAARNSVGIKKAIVKGIPRQAVLKPAHALYRLQNQHFALGDRVTMVQDSGGVPPSAKGVVVGLNAKSMDVVWDNPFISGGTLDDRCSDYRGLSVPFNSCLNLTNPQFVARTNSKEAPRPLRPTAPFRPRFGPHPEVKPASGHQPAAGFRPANAISQGPIRIMANPNRVARPPTNGYQAATHHGAQQNDGASMNPTAKHLASHPNRDRDNRTPQNERQVLNGSGRGAYGQAIRGGRGHTPRYADRGRGMLRGNYRGRARDP